MISEWFYFAVKAACFGYLVWRLWSVLFNHHLFGTWAWLFGRRQRSKDIDSPPSVQVSEVSVLGRTNSVYLEDPAVAVIVPERSEELPRNELTAEEPYVDADEVEHSLSDDAMAVPPSEEELYDDEHEPAPLDADFSQGVTYQELANVVEVLQSSTVGREQTHEAARTIFNMKNTDLFEFFTAQIGKAETAEKLLDSYIDDSGQLSQQVQDASRDVAIRTFDWDRYM